MSKSSNVIYKSFAERKMEKMKFLEKELRIGKTIWVCNPYDICEVEEIKITNIKCSSRKYDECADNYNNIIIFYHIPSSKYEQHSYLSDLVGYGEFDGEFDKYIGFQKKAAYKFSESWKTDASRLLLLEEHYNDWVRDQKMFEWDFC